MTVLKRVVSAVAAIALCAAAPLALAAPASAETAVLLCADGAGVDGMAEFTVSFPTQQGADSPAGPIDVSIDGGVTWEREYYSWQMAPPFSSVVDHVYVGGDGKSPHAYTMRWITPGKTYTCSGRYYPIGVDAHAPVEITRGDELPILVDTSFSLYPDLSHLTAVAYLGFQGVWKPAASARVTEWGGAALVNLTPEHTSDLEIRIFDDAKDPGHTKPLGVKTIEWIIVNQPTPLVDRPTTVYAGKTATVSVWYGKVMAGYWLILERWNGDMWDYVDDSGTAADAEGVLQWKPTKTAKYRLVYIADVNGYAKRVKTQTFTVNVAYKVTVSAPTSVKKNTNATFAVTHKLGAPSSASLQKWSGSKWVTVKTFVPSRATTKVTAKISATGKWRVVAGGYISNTVTVKAT